MLHWKTPSVELPDTGVAVLQYFVVSISGCTA